MKRLLGALLLSILVLCGCGGGGGGGGSYTPPVIPPGTQPRADAYFAYYGDFDGQFAETREHVNAAWIWAWTRENWWTMADRRLSEARAAGIHCIVMGLPGTATAPEGEQTVRTAIQAWSIAGHIPDICGFTPVDEPDGAGKTSEAQLRAWAAMMRRVMADYPAVHAKLFIMYAKGRPAIDVFDVIAWDDYDMGVGVLGEPLVELKKLLRPDQKYATVPGGWDSKREDPEPFLAVLQSDPQNWGIVAFIYGTQNGQLGIRDNGMLPRYCLVGKKIKNSNVPTPVCP